MANTQYQSLIDSVFSKIKDLDLAQMDEKVATQIVSEYISPACTTFQSCDQNLDDRDDILQEFNFKLTRYNHDILVKYIILEWLSANYIFTTSALKARLSSSDFKSLNLPQSLDKVMTLYNEYKSDTDQLAINKSYINSKIFDICTGRKKV